MRMFVNRALKAYTQAPLSDPNYTLDTSVNPKARGTLQLSYEKGSWNLLVQERYIHSVLMNANIVVGTNDTNRNDVPAVWYTDMNLSYTADVAHASSEFYLGITNLLDRDPPVDLRNPTSFSSPTTSAYDRAGRYFNAGLRLRF